MPSPSSSRKERHRARSRSASSSSTPREAGSRARRTPRDHGLDDVITADVFHEAPVEGQFATRRDEIVAMVREERQTLRRLLERIAGARTHRVLVGTPREVAASMDGWFRSGACDGFNLMPPTLPGGLEDFVELVLPELERRGVRTRPPSTGGLRHRLALPSPV